MRWDCRCEYVCLRSGGLEQGDREKDRWWEKPDETTQKCFQWSTHYLSLTESFSKPMCPNMAMCTISRCLFEDQPCPSNKPLPETFRNHTFTLNTALLFFDYSVPWPNCHKHNLVLLHTVFGKPELSLLEPTWRLPLFMLRDCIIHSTLENVLENW